MSATRTIWLSEQPPVVFCAGFGAVPELRAAGTVFVVPPRVTTAHELVRVTEQLRAHWAPHVVVVLVPDVKLVNRTRHAAIMHGSPHVLLDAAFWDFQEQRDARYYDACLVTAAELHGRSGLAASVPRLCCLGYSDTDATSSAARMRRQLAAAAFPFEPSAPLPARELRRSFYRQSRTGILLDSDSGSIAAGEQQLCGLPIVAVGQHAGTLATADPDFLRVVSPEREAVAAAVRELAAADCDPREVRDAFLARVTRFRQDMEARAGCALRWSVL